MISDWTNQLHTGDALATLREMPSDSVHTVMFSPPYWGLRDYGGEEAVATWGGDDDCDHDWSDRIPGSTRGGSGTPNDKHNRGEGYGRDSPRGRVCHDCGAWRGQFGLEPTVERYAEHLVMLGEEVRRVLREDGSWWLNIGDSYSNSNKRWTITAPEGDDGQYEVERRDADIPDKCKTFTPHRVALELIEDGWILRNDAVWRKTNPMPSPVQDRLSTSFEWLYHLTPSEDYFYDLDAIREPYASLEGVSDEDGARIGKNPGDVLELATDQFDEGHFAVYPPELVEKPVKASCPPKVCADCGAPYERQVEEVERPDVRDRDTERTDHNDTDWNNNRNSWAGTPKERRTVGWESTCECDTEETEPGVVLDPFCGRGTTCKVAAENGRRYVGIDINDDYIDIAEDFVPSNRQGSLTEDYT